MMKQSLDTRTKLLTKSPFPLMLELSIPAVLGMVVVGLYNMMDSIFVGQMVGAAQMGAVSVSYPFTLINAGSAAMLGGRLCFGAISCDWKEGSGHRKKDYGKPDCNGASSVCYLHCDRYGIYPPAFIFGRRKRQYPELCGKVSAYCVCRKPVCEFLPECEYGHSWGRAA